MWFIFYVAGLIAILVAIKVITHTNPMHALLYLIVFLLALSIIFFSIGSYFAGALEIIVYAGAIMVLFVFVVMMLNLSKFVIEQERNWIQLKTWIYPIILSTALLSIIIYAIVAIKSDRINGKIISAKVVGINLFSSYVIAVELTSLLLLAGLIVAFHLGREKRLNYPNSNRSKMDQ
ncbi:MAG: NADH-quinone oxidoreductase subunit J [Arsenophonus sp. ET-KM2-MAG3]